MSARRAKDGGNGRKASVFRLHPARQAMWVGIALVAAAAGYGAAGWLAGDPPPSPPAASDAAIPAATPAKKTPWYAQQAPPPAMVVAPATPIFPEPNGETDSAAPRRAYEEALPADVRDASPRSPAASAPPASPAASVPAAPSSPPPAVATSTPPVPGVPAGEGAPVAASSAEASAKAEAGEAGAGAQQITPAWKRYALATPAVGSKPMIAIVIDDMGMDRKRSARAVKLPGVLTLSYLTYADDLKKQTAAAKAAGHEILMHVGMEPTSTAVDPGPNVLRIEDPPREIRRRLTWGLDRAAGYVGINNHMGSKFTADADAMAVVMAELKARGLLFLDSRTTPHSTGAREAQRFGVPVLERNVFLDNVNKVEAVDARLAETERIAARHGAAIAIGHPRDATLAALAAWIPKAAARGFVLVPLTAILLEPHRAG